METPAQLLLVRYDVNQTAEVYLRDITIKLMKRQKIIIISSVSVILISSERRFVYKKKINNPHYIAYPHCCYRFFSCSGRCIQCVSL